MTSGLTHDDQIFLDLARLGDLEAFGHREHLRLAYAAAHRGDGSLQATTATCEQAIRRIAAKAGQPDKFHKTITTAWTALVLDHVRQAPERSFEQLLGDDPALTDSRALLRFFSSGRLADPTARTAWVEPDLAPLPCT